MIILKFLKPVMDWLKRWWLLLVLCVSAAYLFFSGSSGFSAVLRLLKERKILEKKESEILDDIDVERKKEHEKIEEKKRQAIIDADERFSQREEAIEKERMEREDELKKNGLDDLAKKLSERFRI